MLRNYLKIAVRSLMDHRGYSLINVLGLAIGMASCLLVALFVQHEVSYDSYHQKANRIYRLVSEDKARMPIPLGTLLARHLPGVEKAVRVHGGWGPAMSYGDRQFYHWVRFADAEVFALFDFDFRRGEPATALKRPYTIVISPRVARRFFGDEDPIGKLLTWDDTYDYEVTAVVDVPLNTHFRFDLLASYSTVSGGAPCPLLR